MAEMVTGAINYRERMLVRQKGARLKSERNLSLTVGLKVLYKEYRPRKEELR